MEKQTAVVLGSTGLTGKTVVEELLGNKHFSKIRLPVRKPFKTTDSKVEVVLTDFNDIDNLTKNIGEGDCLFCCIGTTLKAVKGDLKAYRKVDHDIAVNAAKIGIREGFKQFILVSSVGANAGSSNFYLTLKGEIEKEISLLPFEGIHIFRPSVLLGSRNQFRLVEKLSQGFMRFFSFLLIGSLSKYKSISAKDVAKAMVAVAEIQTKGVHIYHYEQIKAILSAADVGKN